MRKLPQLFLLILSLAGCRPGETREQTASSEIRIISTAPALTELVCAVGASGTLVGRTDVCDYPQEIIKGIPVTGKFAMPNMEQVLTQKPTHLLESTLVNPVQKKSLEHFGIKIEHFNYSTIDDIPAAIRQTGELTRHRKQAENLAAKLKNDIAKLKAVQAHNQSAPRTLILLDHLTPITCGTNTFISEMVNLAGANNIATSLKKEYDNISIEWIIEKDPELIICFFELKGDPVQFFRSRTGWKSIKAVQKGRIVIPGKADIICRPGPRILEGVEELRRCIEKTIKHDKT